MGKGLAQRRRLKRALNAAQDNLVRLANGKALPNQLPEAPKSSDAEKLPASFRKMLALKAAAEKQRGDPIAPAPAPSGGKQRKGRKQGEPAAADDGPSTSGRERGAGAAAGAKPSQQQQQPAPEEGQGKKRKGGGVVGGNAFSLEPQFEQRKLKERKKEFLKRREERKHKRGGSGAAKAPVVEKELQLRDKVKFGEVADAPLRVHLKRKHWAGAGKEKTDAERCKEVFLSQMAAAQQRMGSGAAVVDDGVAVGRRGGSGGGGSGGGGGGRAAGKKGAGAQHKAAPAAGLQKRKPDEDTEALRLATIEAYRASKKGPGAFHSAAVGSATLSSLAQLVGGGGKAAKATHTLD